MEMSHYLNTSMTIRVFLTLALIAVMLVQCTKNTSGGQVLTGRLIVNGPCEHFAVQLLSGTMDTTMYVSSWHDIDNDSTYANAFYIKNYCTFAAIRLQVGDSISFQIDPHPITQTCPICFIGVSVPPKGAYINNVQKLH
jgi:hypothetical protein